MLHANISKFLIFQFFSTREVSIELYWGDCDKSTAIGPDGPSDEIIGFKHDAKCG